MDRVCLVSVGLKVRDHSSIIGLSLYEQMPKSTQRHDIDSRASQASIKKSIDIGPELSQVSPVVYWYRNNHFVNDDEARGAFRLAYQQGLDGMGRSIPEWMGLTEKEYYGWLKNEELPCKAF